MTDYEKQANDFLVKTGTEFSVKFDRFDKYFPEDEEERDIYLITLKRGERKYTFTFGQSLYHSGFYWSFATSKTKNYLDRSLLSKKESEIKSYIKRNMNSGFDNVKNDFIHFPVEPTCYNVFACLEKYDVGSFEDFCAEFGYDTDSKKAEKTYHAVKEEYLNICILYTDEEIEELREIQ
jgi:hypothetical protein